MPALHHAGWVLHAAFSPDGLHLATACEDGLVRIWDLVMLGEGAIMVAHPPGPGIYATDAKFSPDGQRLAATRLAEVGFGMLFRAPDWAPVACMRREDHVGGVCGFSPDGTKFFMMGTPRYTMVTATNAAVCDATTGDLLFEVAHGAQLTHSAFDPSGRYPTKLRLKPTSGFGLMLIPEFCWSV